jgi:hypothetical protein
MIRRIGPANQAQLQEPDCRRPLLSKTERRCWSQWLREEQFLRGHPLRSR